MEISYDNIQRPKRLQLYFENDLIQKKIENIKVFKITNKDKEIKNLIIIRE